MAVNFRPLHDRVLVRRVDQDQKSSGGIIIPDTAQEKPSEGEIIAVGGGRIDDNGGVHALDVKAGDLILFGKWSGTEVKVGGEDLLIMKESDILGIIEKKVLRRRSNPDYRSFVFSHIERISYVSV